MVPIELVYDINKCVSHGVGSDISFENDLYSTLNERKTNVDFYFYDHTVNGLPNNIIPNPYFFKKRITAFPSSDSDISPNDTLRMGGNILWKFDIEGGEYEFIDNIDPSLLNNVKMIVMELHWLNYKKYDALRLLEYINKYFTLFHIHGNNYSNFYTSIGDYKIPHVVEMTFVNNGLILSKEIPSLSFPICGTDYPNNPMVCEMELSWLNRSKPNQNT